MITFPIFERFGGQEPALGILAQRRGKLVTEHALEHWKIAREIPDWAKVAFLEECTERGLIFRVEDCRAVLPQKSDRSSLPVRSRNRQLGRTG